MRIVFEASYDEKLEVLYKCLVNMEYAMNSMGLEVEADGGLFDRTLHAVMIARNDAGNMEVVCKEDVYIAIIKIGGKLDLIDNNEDEPSVVGSINVATLLENWSKVPTEIMMDLHKESGDSFTAFDFLQVIAMGQQNYG